MNKQTRRFMYAALIALALAADSLITARVIRTGETRATGASAVVSAPDDALLAFRQEREQLRARSEAQLREIIYSVDSEDDASAQARRQLTDMLARAEAEATIEGVLRSRGFEDALVTVSAHSANVLTRGEAPTQRQAAVILELVMRETGLTAGNVKIIPVK